MEKLCKRCAACGESCAEKFVFCPGCGARLGVEAGKEKAAAARMAAPADGEADGFAPTIVEEAGGRRRNALMLGALALTVTLAAAGFVYSLFNKALELGALETDDLYAFVDQIEPSATDPAEELKKAAEQASGGGSGGDNDPVRAQKGRAATQVDDPLFAPSKTYVRLDHPDLKIRAATKGTHETPQKDEPYGLKDGGLIPSDGEGCCGGQGNKLGRGQGTNPGPGLGPGTGPGPGGPGGDPNGGPPFDKEDVPIVRRVPNEPLKILVKPRAQYTDLARENVVQGKVVLRVTFLANGQIGPIVPVSGLPFGLTERAIAAARAIKFEPARAGGQPVAVTKVLEYNFTIF